jgi:hypothetical protein
LAPRPYTPSLPAKIRPISERKRIRPLVLGATSIQGGETYGEKRGGNCCSKTLLNVSSRARAAPVNLPSQAGRPYERF